MNESKTYKEWYQFAMQYSNSYGYYEWRRSTNDKHFDYVEIQHRTKGIRTLINEIEKATEAGNTQQADDYFSNLQTHLRFDLTRGPCKILRPEAFKYCIGTKKVIEEYIEQIQKSLEFISEYQSASLLDRYHYLSACLKTHGHTALLLSGGQSLSLYHLGVCRFLHDMNFLPRVICGTGTAAIIASFVCCNHDRELKLLLDASQEKLDFSPFTNKRQQGGLIARCGRRLRRLCEEGTLMDINVVAEFVEHHLGDTTFAEAFKKTGRVLNIVICNLNECQTILPHTDYTIPQPLIGGGETRWVANYLTAPDVLIRTAAVAAVSQGILASMLWKGYCLKRKNPSTGEVEVFSPCAYVSTKETAEALAIQRLSEQFNVTCIMRAKTKLRLWQSGACASSVLSKPHKSWLRLHTERAIHEVLHEGLYRTHKLLKWLRRVPILGTTSKRLLSLDIFLKDVDVDIELSSYEGFTLRMLEHPSRSLVTKGLHDGERSIWPRLSNIQLHLAVEDSFNLVLSRLLEKIQTESAKEQESSIGPVVIIPDFPFPQTFRTGKYVHRNPTLSLIPFPMADEEVLSDGGSSVESNRYHEYGAGFGSMIMRHVSRRRGSGASEHHHDKVAWSDE
eukprot:TRINITY_DN13520_c0_g1_i1.p1 TRINITY_DN13520_c0_g1~~TRINITY_DN13520_c0_g1_i1.p1  ORF type:complete len:680 (+),score=96.70 TRINITY_DN13520_c0_g1_i1:185-2041(+)